VVVDGLSKTFRIPRNQPHTLKERVLHPFRSTHYEQLEALRDVAFAIPEGEFFGIVGRNGSGKSTLLKCLAGIYEPTSGGVGVKGRMATIIELGVGFNPELSARDNVIVNATMLGLTRRDAAARFDEIIAFAELEDFLELKLKNYSSGMNVRLAFSTAVQVDADVLLVDEVLAVGDAAFQQKCHDVFQRLKDEGKTIIFVTHDMSAVERFCDRAMLLEKGEIVDIGDPVAIGRAYNETNFGRRTVSRPNEERYGNQREAEISSVWFEQPPGTPTIALTAGAPAAVAWEVLVHEDVDAIATVTLWSEAHLPVLRVSSEWHEEFPGHFEGGGRYTVRAVFDCVLAPGSYDASPSIAPAGNTAEIIDLRERFGSVVVYAAHAVGGIVDLPVRFEVERR
jgi:ABC-type polysaccharide/polyol phosphate transport system ATPase subunit